MTELDSLLKQLIELNDRQKEQQAFIDSEHKRLVALHPDQPPATLYNQVVRQMGHSTRDTIFAALSRLCGLYPGLTPDEKARVRQTVHDNWYIVWGLSDYISRQAERLRDQASIPVLRQALVAALIEDDALSRWRTLNRPLQEVYEAARDSGMNPDIYFKQALKLADTAALRSVTGQFAHLQTSRQRAVNVNSKEAVLDSLQWMFDDDMQQLLTELLTLGKRYDEETELHKAEFKRLRTTLDDDEAHALIDEQTGNTFRQEFFKRIYILCREYPGMSDTQQKLIRDLVGEHNALLSILHQYMLLAIDRMSHGYSEKWLRSGLVATAIDYQRFDYRASLAALGRMYEVAHDLKLDPAAHFQQVGKQCRTRFIESFPQSVYFRDYIQPRLTKSDSDET